MQVQGKALYNLLRINWLEDPSMKVESWQVENTRELPLEEIFARLKALDISLTQESFLLYAENCDTPEDLTDCLWVKEDEVEQYDQAYLLFFELWRRFLPDKQSLSIFCDELDWNIELYDRGQLDNEDLLQSNLTDLEDILDEHIDQGADPQETFQLISQYCAHDLENFIYDYITDQIDSENELYASELLEGFAPYIQKGKWFDFLRARLLAAGDVDKSNVKIQTLLEQLQEEPDLALLLEIAQFLVVTEDIKLFVQSIKQAANILETEEDFQRLLQIFADYYRLLDKEEEEQAILQILQKRQTKQPTDSFSLNDAALKELQDLLKNLDRTEV